VLVQRPRLRHRQQPERRIGRASLVLGLRGEERTLRPAPQIGRQLGGALVKCRPRRQPAARPRSRSRALQLSGDVLVEPGCRLSAVPGTAIRIDVGYNARQPADDVANYLGPWSKILENGGYSPDEARQAALMVLPDILPYDRTQPATYPNGRILTDDVYSARFAWLTNGKVPPSGCRHSRNSPGV
jgi:hypothetical protein